MGTRDIRTWFDKQDGWPTKMILKMGQNLISSMYEKSKSKTATPDVFSV